MLPSTPGIGNTNEGNSQYSHNYRWDKHYRRPPLCTLWLYHRCIAYHNYDKLYSDDTAKECREEVFGNAYPNGNYGNTGYCPHWYCLYQGWRGASCWIKNSLASATTGHSSDNF